MTFGDDLKAQVVKIFNEQWTKREGRQVPESDDVGLGNDAITLDGTVLYADLSESTALVNKYQAHFAGEVYKAYLYCAAKIVRAEGGEVTAYDGDRIMAVYLGDSKNTSAVRTALKINFAVAKIINPALKAQYPESSYEVKQSIGIDTSPLFVARTGIRGSNDLVWVGRAANYAAKLASLSDAFPSWITKDVYERLAADAKTSNGNNMWEARQWTAMNDFPIYGSRYWWEVE